MEKFKNLKIKGKLLWAFGSIIALSVLIVILLINSMVNISQKLDRLYEGPYQNVDDIWVVRRNLIDIQRAINKLMAEGNNGLAENYSSFKSTVDTDVSELQTALSNLDTQLQNEDTRQQLENIKAMVESGESIRAQVMELLSAGDFDGAYSLNYDKYMPIVDQINGEALALFNAVSEDADDFVRSANNGNLLSISAGVVFMLLGVIIAVAIALKITVMICEPVGQLTDAAALMYKGDMKASKMITYESKDELGALADCMRGTMNNLNDYVEEISSSLIQIAKGDLTQSGDEITDFLGDFAGIKESLVFILKRFNSTLTDIRATADQVDSGSTEIAGAALSLSDGTTEEAGALEELTATIESVSAMAADSAKKTQEAYENAKKSMEEAERGSEQMRTLTGEMERITAISKEIENIITAIEDIASQTNLLSLNASIEAARAGDAGKGFAVVADQIGKLASDSAQSAVSTRELIIKTLEEIEKGNAVTLETSQSFEKVIGDMREFAEAARSTNENAKSQAESLKQVEGGIEQISGVVQHTAAAAEESSAISEQLSDKAHAMDKLVRRFKLFQGGESIGFED